MLKTALTITALVIASTAPAVAETVVVGTGDTLSEIAAQHLGSASRWQELCEANSQLLRGNCNIVQIGAILTLPGTSPTPLTVAIATPIETTQLVAGELVPARELPAELVTLTTTSEAFDDRPIIDVAVANSEGARRIRYIVEEAGPKTYLVSWPLRADQISQPTILLYTDSRRIYGRLEMSYEDGALSIGSTIGEITNASINDGADGWSIVTFAITTDANQTSAQVLLYPTGISNAAPGKEVNFEMVPPVVRR